MKTSRQITGKRGEEQACDYLCGIGHTIVERNWRNAHLELDIISMIHNELHIVEVKTRTAPVMAAPEINVDSRKRKRMVAAAKAYLHDKDRIMLPRDTEIFFDVLTVVFDGPEFEIEYYPQAFIPIYA